jgi:heat shock protein HtpX
MNRFKTFFLLAALTALFMWVGQSLAGQHGMMFAFVFAAVMNFGAYWFSDKIVLRMYNAQPADESSAPVLYDVVRNLAIKINMPMPKIYVIPQDAPNAFATGRNPDNAAVAATEGLLAMLNRDELEGVLAHELGHVKNRDTLISTLAATIAGALSHLANMAMWGMMLGGRSRDDDRGRNPLLGIVGVIVAPMAAMLIQMAISRSREYLADDAGAHFTGNPLALASALQKIEGWKKQIPMTAGSPASAHLFIINPFSASGLSQLFSTHPPTAERIKRLEELAHQGILPR